MSLPFHSSATRFTSGLAAALLAALVAAPAFADTTPPPLTRDQVRTVVKLCRADYARLCADVSPGGGRVYACLKTHTPDLDPGCATALTKAEAQAASQAVPK